MDLPEDGSKWYWTSGLTAVLNEVPVRVKLEESDQWLAVEILDEDVLEELCRLGERTLDKNGGDVDNAEEVVPLITVEDDDTVTVSNKKHMQVDRFYEECQKEI